MGIQGIIVLRKNVCTPEKGAWHIYIISQSSEPCQSVLLCGDRNLKLEQLSAEFKVSHSRALSSCFSLGIQARINKHRKSGKRNFKYE